jgi:hypothetical protein
MYESLTRRDLKHSAWQYQTCQFRFEVETVSGARFITRVRPEPKVRLLLWLITMMSLLYVLDYVSYRTIF